MKIKVFFLCVVAAMMFPITAFAEEVSSPQPHDYRTGLLDDSNILGENNLDSALYDNNPNVAASLNNQNKMFVKFKHPVDLESFYVNATSMQNRRMTMTIEFENQVKKTFQFDNETDYFFPINQNDVTRVDFYVTNKADVIVGEIEFFGTYDPSESPPPETPDDLEEVKNLEVKSTDERADLSWENPNKYFDKAKIYRRDLGEEKTSLNPFAPRKVYAAEDYKPLFETNGTEFSDLSIEPEKTYEYKVTTTYDGMETKGVTVQTSIPKPPLVDLGGLKLPFGVVELIKSGNGLFLLVSGFVLLALAFVFVPKVIKLIRESVKNGNTKASSGYTPRLTDRQMKQAMQGEKQPREQRQSSFVPREPRVSKRGW